MRLTITLPQNLLGQVDRLIDGQNVRNRSHAIERLIHSSLTPTVSTAVILAGGTTREGQMPTLAPIQGQALIYLISSHLIGSGIQTIVVLAGRNFEAVRDYLGDGRDLDANIYYVPEARPLGTAGALKLAERYLVDGPFMVVHGDILTDINVADFTRFHLGENTLATIAVKPRRNEPNYGKVLLQGNRITEFREASGDEGISIVNTGVYLFEPEILELIELGHPAQLESDVFPKLAGMGELSAFLFQGIWFDISTPENYQRAQARWRQRGGIEHVTTN